jgi:hypothetical protein
MILGYGIEKKFYTLLYVPTYVIQLMSIFSAK